MVMETEISIPVKHSDERSLIIQEYEAIIESLQQDLKECKIEQARLRTEVESLRIENESALDVAREAFSHVNIADCPGKTLLDNQECIENLKKQISIIEFEKESMYQLWQTSLKAVETLEREIKLTTPGDDKATKYYEEQVNNVKKAYTEVIQALELKIVQARDNFVKHQTLWESSQRKFENLEAEKNAREKKLSALQRELMMKDQCYQQIIEDLKTEFGTTRQELDAVNNFKLKLETELIETRCLAAKMAAKDEESRNKVAEALDLIEVAVKEKEEALEREAKFVEEKLKVEKKLTGLSEEFSQRLDQQLTEAKEKFEENIKKYMFEIKELKAELRDKATLTDRFQREARLFEEELQKAKRDSEEFMQKSSLKILELENKLKEAEYKLNLCEQEYKLKYEEALRHANNKVIELEEKLTDSNDKLRRNKISSVREAEERVREADERTREAVERYSSLEKRLARALDERETFASELRTLQVNFDREMARRDNERRILEGRVRELQEDLRNANDLVDKASLRATSLVGKIDALERNLEDRRKTEVISNELIKPTEAEKTLNYKVMCHKYGEKIAQLNKYVKIHQTLSNRWKEEAESLTSKFQKRYKELRAKMDALIKDNEELNKELAICKQQVVVCRSQLIQRLDNDNDR